MLNSRKKGVEYEIKLMGELREFYPDVKTSRNASKLIDDLGVDFVNTAPYAIQAKASERSIPEGILLKQMKKNFPEDTPVIIRKRNYQGETATLRKKDFYELIRKIQAFEKGKI